MSSCVTRLTPRLSGVPCQSHWPLKARVTPARGLHVSAAKRSERSSFTPALLKYVSPTFASYLIRHAILSDTGAVVSICTEPLPNELPPGTHEPRRVVMVVAGPENCGCF